MPRFQSTFDGAELFYRDYIPASTPKPYNPKVHDVNESQPALLFLHQWPLTSEMWDPLMVQLSETYRFRCIAPDRRGFGRSDWNGVQLKCTDIDYNVFAKDVVDLLEKLQIGKFVFIAASMGGGESLLAYQSSDYIRQHCQGFIWTNTSLPYPVATADFPQAASRESWNQVIEGIRQDRVSFFAGAFKGPLGTGENEVPDRIIERFERMAESAHAVALERSVQIFTYDDFSEKLADLGEKSEVPILLLHGATDAGTPVEVSAGRIKQIIPRATLKVYEKASHILVITHANNLLADILEFLGVA